MNILITGASGFVGTNLINYLDKSNTRIDALDLGQKFSNSICNSFNWNNFNELQFENYNAVIHLAGKAHDTRNQSTKEAYIEINFGLTKKISDKFLNSQSECFIFFSSVKAVADVVTGEELNEGVTPLPVGPYGESKLMAEEYILEYFRKDDERLKNKRVYILRPCMIHGPGNKGNLNLLYSVVKKGIPWPLGTFNNKRSFTSVENLCYIVSKLIDNKNYIPSGIYNIADDEPISTNRIIELISEVNNKKTRILKLNSILVKTIAHIGDILHLPINSLRLQKLTENYVVSNKKIKEALSIEKLPETAEAGLIKTLKSFKNK